MKITFIKGLYHYNDTSLLGRIDFIYFSQKYVIYKIPKKKAWFCGAEETSCDIFFISLMDVLCEFTTKSRGWIENKYLVLPVGHILLKFFI